MSVFSKSIQVNDDTLIIELTQQSNTPSNPMVFGVFGWEPHGKDVVGGVPGGGQDAASHARLVDGAVVRVGCHKRVLLNEYGDNVVGQNLARGGKT